MKFAFELGCLEIAPDLQPSLSINSLFVFISIHHRQNNANVGSDTHPEMTLSG